MIAPQPDEESAAFWRGLEEGRIVLQTCTGCDRRRFPRMPTCPYCGSDAHADVEVAGTGVVYSWVRAERALSPATAAEVPYCIATVDLDGGGRIHGRLEPAAAARIGLDVRPVFATREGWTELRFAPAEGR